MSGAAVAAAALPVISPALGWVGLAGAVVLLRRPTRAGPSRHRGHAAGRRNTPRAGRDLTPLAVAALGVACVVTGGVPGGLVAALVCCPSAAGVLRYLRRRPARATTDPALPVTLDLTAAALRSGRPLAQALAVVAPAARGDVAAELLRVAGLLRLGADPAQAWGGLAARDGPLRDVARVAARSADSGSKVANAFTDLAEQLRAERSAQLTVRANRAGIGAMAPLAACYLPSFVCLGVVPAVVGIAQTTIGVLP